MSEDEDDDSVDEFIAHWNEYLISAFIGLPIADPLFDPSQQEQEQEPQPLTGHVHPLEDPEEQGPARRPKLADQSPLLIPKRIPLYRYLKLQSGATFYFSDDDGKDILTTPTQEPNLYIRKLLSQIPYSVRGRLEFLALFEDPTQNAVIEADLVETDQPVAPTPADLDPLSYLFTDLREELYTAYLREMRMRRAFRTLLQRWRIRRIHKKEHATTDPITLAPPDKPVVLYDMERTVRYVYDARSLATWMESNLLYHEGGFAMPQPPRNPWTNEPFSFPQLVSLYEQLRAHGELRWGVTTLRAQQFHWERWKRFHHSYLTLTAIRSSLTTLDSTDAREMLEDFVFAKMEDLDIYTSPSIRLVYRKAILHAPDHWYITALKGVAYLHYEAIHFQQDRRREIHNRCDRIFAKQDQFVGEIQRMGLLSRRP